MPKARFLASSALTAFVFFSAIRAPGVGADGGTSPAKHWGTFPGRAVHAVAFRGYIMGGEPSIAFVRSGKAFLAVGKRGLYAFNDSEKPGGDTTLIESADNCSNTTTIVETRYRLPRLVCAQGNSIAAASPDHAHERTAPLSARSPSWPCLYGVCSITRIAEADRGGYWYAYGSANGVGMVDARGRSQTVQLPLLGEYREIAADGDFLYIATDNCTITRLRSLRIESTWSADCTNAFDHAVLERVGDAVWILGTAGSIERHRGTRVEQWSVPFRPEHVAVMDDGKAYVDGYGPPPPQGLWGPAMIALITAGKQPISRPLPMKEVGPMGVDPLGRLWIDDPHDHGAALVDAGPEL